MSVGTLGEKHLHAALKRWYAEDGDLLEQPVDGFVIDIVRDGLLIEIQTRHFSSLKRKLTKLLEEHPVRVVYPVAANKWIAKLDDSGEISSRRLSPKHGSTVDVFSELVSFPALVAHPNLSLDVLEIDEEEVRRFDPKRGWRRKGWVVEERRLVDVTGRTALSSPQDLAALLPEVGDEFTTADLATALGRPRRLAQQMAYCLHRAGAIDMSGKVGNSIVYRSVGS